ncbi:MAG: hypothetical protein J6B68_01695 [Lachnospiraceae bacterium]|nr:hypothetical protein [Lachnospiraceae bacterium]MBP3477560.1 hypothetical protein [Lachnospiraceae bacterium]
MSLDEMAVTILLNRYEELLDIETRESFLRDYVKRHNYVEREEIMRILGYPEEADKIRDQEEKNRQEFTDLCNKINGVKQDAGTD